MLQKKSTAELINLFKEEAKEIKSKNFSFKRNTLTDKIMNPS